jgi:hypothetical protein
LAPPFEFHSGEHMGAVLLIRLDRKRSVITPPVGIADLEHHLVELAERFGTRGVAHPLIRDDAVAHRHLEVLDELRHPRLRPRREGLGDVRLAERFAKYLVGRLRAPLPARERLPGAGEPGIETEVLVEEGRREIR